MLALRLALAELRHARGQTACLVIGLAALLLPMLILFGIKNGVIADRTAALLRDPEALRIMIGRTDNYPATLIRALEQDPDVRFVAPHPIQLAVIADFAGREGSQVVSNVTLLSTGATDPYLPAGVAPPEPGQVILSSPLAGALGVGPGQGVDALLRPNDHSPDGGVLGFEVIGLIAPEIWGRMGALLHPDDLFLIQDWTHGDIPGSDLNAARGNVITRDSYPSMRLYAADADGAARLMGRLAAEGVPTSGTPEKARDLIFLRDALQAGFLTVAIVGLIGVTATFAANLWTAVIRNRRPISLLRLGGLSRGGAVMIPVTQALVVGATGWLLAVLLYGAMTGLLNHILGASFGVEQNLARLGATELLASGAATLAVSVAASVWAAATITAISPEEGFTDAA